MKKMLKTKEDLEGGSQTQQARKTEIVSHQTVVPHCISNLVTYHAMFSREVFI